MSKPIYLDYMATTPVDPLVVEVMMDYLGPDGVFGNPASTTHVYGLEAAKAVEKAREQIAAVIHASPQEIVFTSGATEADNLAIIGAARFYQTKGKHLITATTEHKAVLDSMQQLEQEGFEVTYLNPEENGILNLASIEKAIRPDTILVSIMQVNNEIGVVQDIVAIGDMLRDKGIIFHVDAAQSAGKLPINVQHVSVDLMSFSAHKLYGPKGIGALYIRQKPRIRIKPLTYGGGHEGGMRSGTLATHQIVGMGKAFELAELLRVDEQDRILKFRHALWGGIKHIQGIRLNGDEYQRVAGNLSLTFPGQHGDSLLYALEGLAISKTSACSAGSSKPSHVLKAIGLSDDLAYSTIRLSLGRFTKEEQIAKIIDIINQQVTRLQQMIP